MRPEGLIRELDEMRAANRYAPRALEQTSLSKAAMREHDERPFIEVMLNFGKGETKAELLHRLGPALAAPADVDAILVRDGDGRVLGGFVRRIAEDQLVIDLLRVRLTGRSGEALARHLLFR